MSILYWYSIVSVIQPCISPETEFKSLPSFPFTEFSGYKGPYTLLNPPSQLDNMPTEH